ncbi:general transcription factor 3C polypeptide 5 [Brachypodium distachyon]|uniref:Transcription factor IIIC subunit 5 HTH domain-containing protein n=1 Tax=Brachypodium distachyon TaxID=15368 RepID=A0A0Q3P017_BRADI|nr:general transcription factor 3C polypeptide 5 [Brachypodium distachyon]KQJ82009.1 hypothetical protein BRADI_5g04838v3 [Brachypodium distachyon]|eukprot:XP_010239742.1 general transcription factor 3C polypeptide 5 [Brachypodium distachyon]
MTSPVDPTAAAPQSPSIITNGAVNGLLPGAEAFAVHYPGYPSSPARAAHTLGGLPTIAKVRSSKSRLELRFRPEDPYCHPAFGEPRASTGLLLRLSRPKGDDAPPRAEVVARVRNAYYFEGMADFQHVVPVQAANVRKRNRPDCPSSKDDLGRDKVGDLETDDEDAMMLIPPLFSIKDSPTKIALLASSNALSKSMQRGVVRHRWEMDIEPTLALSFDIQAVPKKINWEDHIPKKSPEWGWQMAMCKLFEERPVWPRQSLYERLLDEGVQVSQGQFKSLLFKAGYYFSTGPFGKFWIRKEYDPRKDPESRIYQMIDFRLPPQLRNLQTKEHCGSEKWSEMCKLERMPSKSFIFLQLFELKDDFIQAEIRKPSHQPTCSHSTGWFSKPMIKILRSQLSIRFLSLCPIEDAKIFLRDAREAIERSKKQEDLCRSKQLKERQEFDEEAPEKHAGSEGQVDNFDCEDIDDEEEEDKEESDGYDSPPMAEDVRDFSLHDSYTIGEGFPTGYLDGVLRSFPVNEDGQIKLGDALNNTEGSDGEFEIFEQPSDDEEYSDG